MLRDQGVNIAIATFGGVALLGLWSVAWRIIQLPVSLFAALWRVSFPGMSRLVAAKEDVGSTIERVIALVAIGTGVLVAPLAASASAWIHVLIGAQWANAASAIPPACFAMTFGVPISVALSGYLWAIGSASVPLRATAVGIPATLLLLLPLLPSLGVAAAGIAYIASSLVESLFFVYAARRTTTFRIGSRLAIPVLLCDRVGIMRLAYVARWIGPDLAGALVELGRRARRLPRRPSDSPTQRPRRRLETHRARTTWIGRIPRRHITTAIGACRRAPPAGRWMALPTYCRRR